MEKHECECAGSESLLSTSDAASLLGIRPGTLRVWRVKGCGPRYIRLGDSLRAQVRYRSCDVVKWISSREVGSTAQETEEAAGR